MSEQFGEKTEQATPRHLEEAWKRGQIPRSSEVQTVFVITAGILALMFSGRESWRLLHGSVGSVLGHLHDAPLTQESAQGQVIQGVLLLGQCVWPVLAAAVIGGLLAGGIQSRFRTASEALAANWERVNPVAGFQRLFSFRSAVPTGVAVVKLAVILVLTYGIVKEILTDPIFYAGVELARIADFMASSSLKIVLRVAFALAIIAAADYGYQFWRNQKDLMMTKEEVKEEMKSTEGNPLVKSQQRRRRQSVSMRKMLSEVPHADVVITNPVRLAIALRYDRKAMRAPRIVAKGSRLNARRIREIAQQHQVPVMENKPLARMMFKYGKVGGEIPAQLYAAVAEVLAWIYRVNAYRYYREGTLSR